MRITYIICMYVLQKKVYICCRIYVLKVKENVANIFDVISRTRNIHTYIRINIYTYTYLWLPNKMNENY